MVSKAGTKVKPPSKSEVVTELADATGLSKAQIMGVFDSLSESIGRHMRKTGTFQLPGLLKIVTIHKPATKAGTKPNPFKPGEMMEVKAKPARKVVKVRPLKALKEMV